MSTEQQVVYGVTEVGAKRPGTPSDTSAPLQLTSERLRVWGARAAFSLWDQGLASGASFGVNLLLARWMPAEVYGAFAVAFAGYIFIYGFYNVLLLEPMSVLGPARHAEGLQGYFRTQLVIHAMLVGPLSAVGLVAGLMLWRIAPGSPLAGAIMGIGLALPFILLLWLARRICYAVQRPSVAATGSTMYLGFIALGLLALRHFSLLGPFTAFILMGSGSFLASMFLVLQIGLQKEGLVKSSSTSWREVWLENWKYGRWLVGSAALSSVVSQAQVFFVSALLGLGAAGVLRAMQLPALLITQVSTATGFLILPVFAYDVRAGAMRRMRQKAILVSLGISTFALILGAVTWAFSGPLERALFSGKYASYAWLMPVLVLVTVAYGPMQGFGMALRAIRRPQFDLVSGVYAAPIAILCAYLGTMWWGYSGAVLSLVLGFAIQAGVTSFYFRRLVWNQGVPDELAAIPLDSK
jgi:O-antigen/teichoic acid export membrane protein